MSKDGEKTLFVIAVKNSFLNDIFTSIIDEHHEDIVIIVDEVHEHGANEYRKRLKLLSKIKYRLGLSATPLRLWDNEGNAAIREAFGEESVFVWGIDKAINPPDGYTRCLSKYNYYIFNSVLNDDELEMYEELSLKISKRYAIISNNGKNKVDMNEDPSLVGLLRKRAQIIKECQNNERVLLDIINEYDTVMKKCIVYCNNKNQLDRISRSIESNGYKCRKYYGNLNDRQREEIFYQFEKSEVKYIVAIKCLDQGVDLPFADSAIILASSKNPREYVQRRGRILRLHKDKDIANIFDVLVLPASFDDLYSGKVTLEEFEVRLLEKQIERLKIFSDNSDNYSENYLRIMKYGDIIVNNLKGKIKNGQRYANDNG